MLSQEQIDQFVKDGILVVDNVLSPSQLSEANDGLSRTLASYGVDTDNLLGTGLALTQLSSTNGSGGVLDLFYPEWKMNVASNPLLFHATCQLWEAAYCHDGEAIDKLPDHAVCKWHPYGAFDCQRGYMYIDRIGYRIPTVLAENLGLGLQQQSIGGSRKNGTKAKPIQRSLTPHLDCCPQNLFSDKSKWRPIQCFVSLTNNMEPNTGGFEAVPGFHTDFHKWSRTRPPTTITKKHGEAISYPAPCIGEYTHVRPKEDSDIISRITHIPVRAGSAVFWDNRIPHANAYRNDGIQARAVVYCSFLPDIPLNREYVQRQLSNFHRRHPPTDQWINSDDTPDRAKFSEDEYKWEGEPLKLTGLGRKLLGLDSW